MDLKEQVWLYEDSAKRTTQKKKEYLKDDTN